MENEKFDAGLQLALEFPEETLWSGFFLPKSATTREENWELIIKYNDEQALLNEASEQSFEVELLIAGFAIIRVKREQVEKIASYSFVEYVEIPKELFLQERIGKEISCATSLAYWNKEKTDVTDLTGKGVVIGIIDSGVDLDSQKLTNRNGGYKLKAYYDVPLGQIYESEEVEKLREEADSFQDPTGHGTSVMQIATELAPDADILVAALGRQQNGRNSITVTTDLMRAVTWMVKWAFERKIPLVINLSMGTTYGSHRGDSLLERFMDNVCEIGRTVICVGCGNEANNGGHCQIIFDEVGQKETEIEMAIGLYESSLIVPFWIPYEMQLVVQVQTPDGQMIFVDLQQVGSSLFQKRQDGWVRIGTGLGIDSEVFSIFVAAPSPYVALQELFFMWKNSAGYLDSGIWKFVFRKAGDRGGVIDAYMPSGVTRNINTRFLKPSPYQTITIPATSEKVVSVGAYDAYYDTYADFSGRGTLDHTAKPDLVAPGVNIEISQGQDGIFNSYRTGTSFAVPFVTGAAALLMEWGIIRENDLFLYGQKVKAYLRRGARTLRGTNFYPNAQAGYGALCVKQSIPFS